MRNNAAHAEDQQERLIDIGWILGLVDGEGCFSINFMKQPERVEANRIRRGYRLGYQVAHEFAVVQGASSIECLEDMKRYFGAGGVYINRRYDNHKEHLYRYCVRKREDIVKIIIPFFEQHPLHTSKREDFQKFVQCIQLMEQGAHLTADGLIKIVRISETMNHKKKKTEMIRILRNQTSAPVLTG